MEERRGLQFRILGRVITIYWKKSGKDYSFNFRITKLEPQVIGINSNLDDKDIYNGQEHIGIIDFDDRLPLSELKYLIIQVQNKFKWVGDGYIYQTSPKKYSIHFYQPASYWRWLMVIHFCNQYADPNYCKYRMIRNTMVMRFSPKSSGYVPKLVGLVKSANFNPEVMFMKRMVLKLIDYEENLQQKNPNEVKLKDGSFAKN